MYAIQLVALSVSLGLGPFSYETRVFIASTITVLILLDLAILKLPLGELFRFSASGTLHVCWDTLKAHAGVLHYMIGTLLVLHLLGLFKPAQVDEVLMWRVIAMGFVTRLLHTVRYIIAFNKSKTKTCAGFPIKYPRGLYVNAFWGLAQCALNMWIILHVGCLWMNMYKSIFVALNIPSYEVGPMVLNKITDVLGMDNLTMNFYGLAIGDLLLTLAVLSPLLTQFANVVGIVWWHGHKGLHETKGGIYVMFHKQHHLNRTPMPADSCTEHIVELADIYCWSNFMMCNPFLMFFSWFMILHTGCKSHNSLMLHDDYPDWFLKMVKGAGYEGSPLEGFKGSNDELRDKLVANHVLHHMHTHCNYSGPRDDLKWGTLRIMSDKEHQAHTEEVSKNKSD
jgi:hypothetical protein